MAYRPKLNIDTRLVDLMAKNPLAEAGRSIGAGLIALGERKNIRAKEAKAEKEKQEQIKAQGALNALTNPKLAEEFAKTGANLGLINLQPPKEKQIHTTKVREDGMLMNIFADGSNESANFKPKDTIQQQLENNLTLQEYKDNFTQSENDKKREHENAKQDKEHGFKKARQKDEHNFKHNETLINLGSKESENQKDRTLKENESEKERKLKEELKNKDIGSREKINAANNIAKAKAQAKDFDFRYSQGKERFDEKTMHKLWDYAHKDGELYDLYPDLKPKTPLTDILNENINKSLNIREVDGRKWILIDGEYFPYQKGMENIK